MNLRPIGKLEHVESLKARRIVIGKGLVNVRYRQLIADGHVSPERFDA